MIPLVSFSVDLICLATTLLHFHVSERKEKKIKIDPNKDGHCPIILRHPSECAT